MWIKRPGLLADRRHDPGMRVPDVGHGDPRREVEEAVAVHVLDHRPLGAAHHQRIDPRVRRRHDPMVTLEPGGAARARQRSQDPRFVTVQRSHSFVLSGDPFARVKNPSVAGTLATATLVPDGKLLT